MLSGEDGTHARTLTCSSTSFYIDQMVYMEAKAYMEIVNAIYAVFYTGNKHRCFTGLVFKANYSVEGLQSLELIGLLLAAKPNMVRSISADSIIAASMGSHFWVLVIDCNVGSVIGDVCGRRFFQLRYYLVSYSLEELLQKLTTLETVNEG